MQSIRSLVVKETQDKVMKAKFIHKVCRAEACLSCHVMSVMSCHVMSVMSCHVCHVMSVILQNREESEGRGGG